MTTTLANWLLYAVVVSGLLALAAWAGEGVLRGVRGEGRWAWVAALAASVMLPVLSYLEWPRLRAATVVAAEPMFVSLPPLMVVSPGSALASTVDRWLLVLWLSTSLVLALFVLLSLWRLRRGQSGWRRAEVDGVAVYVTRDLGPAAVGGGASGGILMPEWALALDGRWRRLMLLHEAEHLRARDPWLLLGATTLLVLVPWNAPMWWQLRRLRLAIELDCDARVLTREPDARAYGSLLLEVGRRRSPSPLVASFAEPRAFLRQRIHAIVERGSDNTRRLTALALVAGCFVVLAAFAGEPVSRTAATLALAPATAAAAGLPDSWDTALRLVTVVPTEDARSTPSTMAIDTPPPPPPPPPLPPVDVRVTPSFTPMTQPPRLINAGEVQQMLGQLYPPVLRDAGIGGAPTVWFFIDETGTVVRTQLNQSGGHPALDEAALKAAEFMRFEPALNREERVAVWVTIPVIFRAQPAAPARPPPPSAAEPPAIPPPPPVPPAG
jgi:TonB family protein